MVEQDKLHAPHPFLPKQVMMVVVMVSASILGQAKCPSRGWIRIPASVLPPKMLNGREEVLRWPSFTQLAEHAGHCLFCCKLTDSPISPEYVDVGLSSQEALLLQISEEVHERLVMDGHCFAKLAREDLNKSHGKRTKGQ